jgi:RNA polymerase sigma factor (sigma-70 family)
VSSVAEQLPDLVGRIAAGDRSAECELVERYGHSVMLILLNRTGTVHLSRDLCQDTFVVALRRLRAGELEKPKSLPAFIRQIAVNISIEYFRREKRYVHRGDGKIALLAAHREDKARRIDQQSARLELHHLLDRLSVSRDREILSRFYLADEDKEQICRDLNLSSAHFDRVLYRARKRLCFLINKQDGLKAELCAGLYEA